MERTDHSVWDRMRGTLLLMPAAMLAGGCGGIQSALNPAGPQAERINRLWWLAFSICAAIYVIVIGVTLVSVLRRRREHAGAHEPPVIAPDDRRERRMARVVAVSVAASVVILFVLLIADFATGRALSSADERRPLTVEIIGHQYWWEVQYADSVPGNRVVTANELHIPVGVPVMARLASRDVIHSLWIPNLHGKRDLIPGFSTSIHFEADRPGTFRGQCAEFCGHQHANMALIVVAEPPAAFNHWLTEQRKPAPVPHDSVGWRGRKVFLSSPCVLCHAIAGTDAGGTVGPNLTHFASRPTIGSGALANNRGNLAGWILDPQHIKPGNHMPPNILTPDDLHALLAYLESLR